MSVISISLTDADFIAPSLTEYLFENGSTLQCISIIINDDSLFEGNETFLMILSSSIPNIMLGTSSTTVEIRNDDCKCIYHKYKSTFP